MACSLPVRRSQVRVLLGASLLPATLQLDSRWSLGRHEEFGDPVAACSLHPRQRATPDCPPLPSLSAGKWQQWPRLGPPPREMPAPPSRRPVSTSDKLRPMSKLAMSAGSPSTTSNRSCSPPELKKRVRGVRSVSASVSRVQSLRVHAVRRASSKYLRGVLIQLPGRRGTDHCVDMGRPAQIPAG